MDGHEVTPGLPNQLCSLGALPPELVDLVFEHTLYDKETIQACTLVSRSWRAVSAPHLFSSLTVVRQASFDDFDGFLIARPDIASCIRELELKQVPDDLDIGSPHAAVASAALAALSAKLPGLQVLRLRRMWISDSSLESPTSVGPAVQRPRMKSLTLHDCSNGSDSLISLRTLHGVLETFPADSVSLFYLTIADASDPDTQAGARWSQLHIEDLTFYHVHAQPVALRLLDDLRQILAPHCLRSLRARLENMYTRNTVFLSVLSEFLIHIGGPQLRHLEFPFPVGSVIGPQEDDPGMQPTRITTCAHC